MSHDTTKFLDVIIRASHFANMLSIIQIYMISYVKVELKLSSLRSDLHMSFQDYNKLYYLAM